MKTSRTFLTAFTALLSAVGDVNRIALIAFLAGGWLVQSAPPARAASATASPLDPLSVDEINAAVLAIESYEKFPAGASFPIVTLKEPAKDEVLSWSPKKAFKRQAFANVYDHTANKLSEAVVDLRTQKVTAWTPKPGMQPAVSSTEFADCDAISRTDLRWQKAMRQRGLNPDDVYLDVWAPGEPLPAGVDRTARLLRVLSFFRGTLPNPYDRPIEGVVLTLDMNKRTVVDFTDTGIRPVNTTLSGSANSTRTGLQPLVVSQPNGPSFQVNGTAVSWQNWHFRIGFNPREGLVLYQIGYEQNGAVRPIIYRIALDDIYVPYALPDPNWAWRAALDVGEYNLGQYAEELKPNQDVPNNAVFFDEATASDTGSVDGAFALPSAVAMFERNSGMLWDRADPSTLARDARGGRELVVTSSFVIGNYTYAVAYIFRMDGGIDVRVGATGTTLTQGTNITADGDKFGTAVTANIAAPSHQHFFNFRIDFDVDGTKNRLVEANTHGVPSVLKNAFVTDETVLGKETFRDFSPTRRWVIESKDKTNALGKPTAYELHPLDSALPQSEADYLPLQHALFSTHALWATRYRDGEMFSVGDYPNQGAPGEGIPKYIARAENVDGKDLVLWYSTGFTHVPAVEEYPVMTTDTIGFEIRPSGFFDRNPALDAP